MKDSPRIIVALDHPTGDEALALVTALGDAPYAVKVGKELFTREGPSIVRTLVAHGRPVFLDLKFHDIPNTVAAACRAAADLGVWMINVHASGGPAMLRAARAALDTCVHRPLLIGVTVLTSLDATELSAIGIEDSPEQQVLRLTRLARECGLDGVVCSPQEIAGVKNECGAGFLTVTPGIRPAEASLDDQQRVATPASAVRAGGDFLVIGRPITRAGDPRAALNSILAEIESGACHG
ncbi:MAG: orotidine-5-phosphate decarboxylase [Pseudomonadota bacterium]|jgi:orotidine-5'-phosphate decarboxylase